ncbi:F-box protein At4g09920-like [Silene latifolia]|uniref:F-box protein At4g09920-like n=1 Tax=Silene latifolia TaxID=37657 RepID=UPI003D787826
MKRKCPYADAGRDRLSEMPDEVIVHILSYMPTLDAVETMLIRPFGNLWTLVHTLNFNVEKFPNRMVSDDKWFDVGRFNTFVHNVLMIHKRPTIDKFHLNYECEQIEAGDDLSILLKFALDKQAKEMYLFDVYPYFSERSDFPNFTSQSLVTLELHDCIIYRRFKVNLGSLKKLILCRTRMHEDTFQQYIRGCPSLQELHIVEPQIMKLRFSAPNIRKLSLVLIEKRKSNYRWSLDFPNLKSLDLETDRIPIVIDVSSIQDVYLKRLYVDAGDKNELRMFNIFLEKFSRSKAFRLSATASEPFLHAIDDWHVLQIRWKRFVFRLQIFCQSCLFGVYQLMRSSKHLEELDIYTDAVLSYTSVCNIPNLFSGQAWKHQLNLVDLPKLKIVTFHGYAKPWKHQLHLVEMFLKSATILEKLVFVPNKSQLTVTEKLDKLDFVMHVSSFQRSSPNARVVFLLSGMLAFLLHTLY